jgi:hypothetical protein
VAVEVVVAQPPAVEVVDLEQRAALPGQREEEWMSPASPEASLTAAVVLREA